jgi:hypothetical protein
MIFGLRPISEPTRAAGRMGAGRRRAWGPRVSRRRRAWGPPVSGRRRAVGPPVSGRRRAVGPPVSGRRVLRLHARHPDHLVHRDRRLLLEDPRARHRVRRSPGLLRRTGRGDADPSVGPQPRPWAGGTSGEYAPSARSGPSRDRTLASVPARAIRTPRDGDAGRRPSCAACRCSGPSRTGARPELP